jgi:hypothetical protein
MSLERKLGRIADEIATHAQKRAAYLRGEYLEAEKLALEKKARFESANLAFKRTANFKVKIGTDYQCPRCWVESGKAASLRADPGDTRDDILRCQFGHEVVITH